LLCRPCAACARQPRHSCLVKCSWRSHHKQSECTPANIIMSCLEHKKKIT
jgi:hypothetical protein